MSDSPTTVSVTVSSQKPYQVKTGVLVLPVFENREVPVDLPAALSREVSAKMRKLDFKGAWGSSEIMVAPARSSAEFIALVGLGDKDLKPTHRAEGLRRGLASVLEDARRHALRAAVLVLPDDKDLVPDIAQAAVEVAHLVSYRFDEHKKSLRDEQAARSLKKLTLACDRSVASDVRSIVSDAQATMAGVTLTRQLVDQPASHASPKVLVDKAWELADANPEISLTVFDSRQARQKKFHAFLAVARGSSQEPYVIHLVYRGKNPKKKVALIGKGITFDSGGLSLKPAQSMTDMKIDMAGAATVLGVFSVLPQLDLDIEVHGIIAACENMPSGDAYRPGDVISSMSGKTIEILNTDAEGRVTMADALTYAAQQEVDAIIDIATLTGAVVVAAGETHAGLWSNDRQLKRDLFQSAREVGEGIVRFPLPPEYKAMVHSSVADVSNTAANHPMAGATTAALFLQEFVEEGVSWAHLDVAGPVHFSKRIIPYWGKGASGYGVRTLLKYLSRQAELQTESQTGEN